MKIKHTTTVFVTLIISFFLMFFFLGLVAGAQARCPGGGLAPDNDAANCPTSSGTTPDTTTPQEESSGVDPDFKEDSAEIGSEDDIKNCDTEGEELSRSNCGIINLLVIGINFLSAIAGIVIIASLMIAGFQYMTAQDDPGKVQKAKSRIVMTLVALTLFIFMYALLNFLVPGGVF